MTKDLHTYYGLFVGIKADTQNSLLSRSRRPLSERSQGYDFGARQYDPAAPRFITPDPLAEKYYGWNMYGYCMNNPVRFIDTDGRKVQIPEKQYREKLVSYINNISSEIFAVNENGLLYNTGIKAESGKSQSYASRINDAIANENLSIAIYIDQEFVNNGVIESISTRGEGITIKEDNKTLGVIISDKPYQIKGEDGKIIEQSPDDILMHELIGHAIPEISPSKEFDTGNAIDNENKIRMERQVPLRERNVNHKQ